MDVQRSTYAEDAMARAMAGEEELFGVVDCAIAVHNPDTHACEDYNELLAAFRAYMIAQRAKGHVFRAAAQNIPNAAVTQILFDTVDFDTQGLWDAANSRWLIQEDGYYLISSFFSMTSLAGGVQVTGYIFINNAQREVVFHRQPAAAGQRTKWVHELWFLNAGDFVDIRLFHNAGAALPLVVGNTTNAFWIVGPF